jgi:hypothetical protein
MATPSFAFFRAFGLLPCGLCCNRCCTTFCIRPYNAFSPACCGNVCGYGCNPYAGSGPGGACDGGACPGGYGEGLPMGQMPVEGIHGAVITPSITPAPVAGPAMAPVPNGHTSLMAPGAMPYGAVPVGYNPMMAPGYNPMMAPGSGYGMMPASVPAYWYGR